MHRKDITLKVIETFIQGKENDPDTCEDGIFIGENIAAVLDGVTAKGTCLWEGRKSGCFGKNLLLKYLETCRDTETPEEFFSGLDLQLGQAIEERTDEIGPEDFPRVSVIVYNERWREIWSYGDCQCRIHDKVYDHAKKIDKMNGELRAFYLEYFLSQGWRMEELEEEDPGRKAIEKNLIMQLAFENKPGKFSYPVLNGQGIRPSMIKRYRVNPGEEIVLASDGYPALKGSWQESEKALQDLLEQDPMCFRLYPSTKGVKPGNVSFDDRAYCRILAE